LPEAGRRSAPNLTTAMNASDTSLVSRLRDFDRNRPGWPGEHWMAFAAGVYLLLRSPRSLTARLACRGAGALLVARALSGRDGAIAALAKAAPPRSEFVEVAATWPYRDRVRITAARRLSRPPGAVQRRSRAGA
jgi:hypothetical protein